MLSEDKTTNEARAYQLGWMAYERGDESCCMAADESFVEMFNGYMPTEGTVGMAYETGFAEAMKTAINELLEAEGC